LPSQPTDARWFTLVTSSDANPDFAEYQRRTTRVIPVVVLDRLG
jgi:F420H(2)-dependent quinone reductase